MNKCAVLHIPLSEYAYAEDEHTLKLRLRAESGDLTECIVFYGDRVSQVEPIPVKAVIMKLTASDELFDYYEAEIKVEYTRVCYYFRISDGKEVFFYYIRGLKERITENRTEYFQFPYIRREDIIRMPRWTENAVIYHIFPDSFANEEKSLIETEKEKAVLDGIPCRAKKGGTLEGIRKNLEYIREMGINCIYLNPIFAASSYHKYDTIDYFEVDPCFGDKNDLKRLVGDCHKKGIRVILDGVFNHCGFCFPPFQDVMKKGKDSEYYDWFYEMPEPILFTDPPSYEAFAYVKEMPKLNTGNPKVADYFAEVGKYWIRETDIDGWRMDVANEINREFWRKFRREVKSIKEDIFLLGEIWEDAQSWLLGDEFDSTMNYTFSYLCRDFFAKGTMKVSEFDRQLHRMLMRYPEQVNRVQMNFLDSHDIPRFLSACGGDKQKMELAMFFLIMMPGIPSVFYGDEAGITGETEQDYRAVMPWKKNPQKEELYQKMQAWILLRKEKEALRKGNFFTCYVNDEKGIYIFGRQWKKEKIVIAVNYQRASEYIFLEAANSMGGTDLLTGETLEGKVKLEGMQGRVWEERG